MRRIPILVALVALVSVDPASGFQGLRERDAEPYGRRGGLHFVDVSSERVLPTVPEADGPNHKMVTAADFDGDGDPDVAMAIAAGTYGARLNKLYRNDDGVLVEVSGSAILPEFALLDVSRHVAFRDFDGDGWLDLVLVNDSFEFGDPIRLFMNRQLGGAFDHFTDEGSLRGLGADWSCGAVARDVDHDGDFDVVSVNYGGLGQDTLYLNDGAGFFTETSSARMPSETDFSVDSAAGDVNGDGKLDLLVCNEGAPAFIYYNDLGGQADQGLGDYKYGPDGDAGMHALGNTTHAALEPADFDLDGRLDLYWANAHGGNEDVVLQNVGNVVDGKAQFVEVALPSYVQTFPSAKVTVSDLDADGLPDAIVMTGDRPAVLRNVSAPGDIRFVDWTSAGTFPAGGVHAGASAAALDIDSDGDLDLLVGGMTDDHVFERVSYMGRAESSLRRGVLPSLLNGAPVTVAGSVSSADADTYRAGSLGSRGHLAVVLSSPGDLTLEILKDGVVQATSARSGAGVREALQVELGSGVWSVRVSTTGALEDYELELLARHDGAQNDLCADALPIDDGLTPFSNLGANTDGPAHAACLDFGDDQIPSDVWFDYVATCTGELTVSTCGMANYDTKLGVYDGSGCPVSDATLLGCNEDTAGCDGYTSIVVVDAVVGQSYKIRVGGWLGAQGTGTLSVSCAAR